MLGTTPCSFGLSDSRTYAPGMGVVSRTAPGETNRPGPSSEAARTRMCATRRKDTDAEVALRRELHRRGCRYRLNLKVVPGTTRSVDIVFPRARVAVFVDGCFWHGCPVHGTWPKANARWWRGKIIANRARDEDTTRRLMEDGWRVVRVWEHEDPALAAEKITSLVHPATTVVSVSRSRPAGTPGSSGGR